MPTKTKSYPKAVEEARASVNRREAALAEIPLPDTSRVDAIQQRLNAVDHAITNDEGAEVRKLEEERQDLAAELTALRAQPDDHEARRRVHRQGPQQARTVLAGEAEANITARSDDRMRTVAGTAPPGIRGGQGC